MTLEELLKKNDIEPSENTTPTIDDVVEALNTLTDLVLGSEEE